MGLFAAPPIFFEMCDLLKIKNLYSLKNVHVLKGCTFSNHFKTCYKRFHDVLFFGVCEMRGRCCQHILVVSPLSLSGPVVLTISTMLNILFPYNGVGGNKVTDIGG